ISQRGDDVVVEFSADAVYGGRQVISYREAPASGAAIAWYVLVDGTTQISVGCQAGTGPAPIDPPCQAAVTSISVRS
ncbi:MAG: type VII secretion-associated protein, partial [Gordonia sp. (in: high G+C Gram-positive bacteria)]|uniref:type VII secretion-associated protein n=1 Tax=Gordonia sp. (in: high G+C Gram-positive bacteria) TaxID=84139 RepID=UPI003BB4DD7A